MGSLASTIELAVVVPCFNERDNVALLVEKLETALFAHFFYSRAKDQQMTGAITA